MNYLVKIMQVYMIAKHILTSVLDLFNRCIHHPDVFIYTSCRSVLVRVRTISSAGLAADSPSRERLRQLLTSVLTVAQLSLVDMASLANSIENFEILYEIIAQIMLGSVRASRVKIAYRLPHHYLFGKHAQTRRPWEPLLPFLSQDALLLDEEE
jgi:hypothetical protein